MIGANIVLNLFAGGAVHDDIRPLFVLGIGAAVSGGALMVGAFAAIGWLVMAGNRPEGDLPR
jgi:hypothetical protein